MDIFSKEKRSQIMSKVKGSNTKLELIIFDLLTKKGIEFEKHANLPGKPDIVFRVQKIAVFIDGDFWHGWKFNNYKNKLTNYWFKKISANIKRDKKNKKILKDDGWRIIRLWEHRIAKNPQGCLKTIERFLKETNSIIDHHH